MLVRNGMVIGLAFWASAAWAEPVAFTGAVLHTGTGEVIEQATLVVEDGRITAVGAEAPIPDGATTVDLQGKVVIPGLVDTHSHIAATGDLNEGSGPLQPALSAIDALDATSSGIQRAQAGGITTANVMPGSGNLMGGQTAYIKLRDANRIDELLLCEDRRTEVCGGMKMANGTNSRRGGAYPGTRMASARMQRELFLEAQKALEKEAGDDKPQGKKKRGGSEEGASTPEPDPRLDPVKQILRGERTVHFHTHRADDVVTAMLMAEEFGFDVVLHHVSEAWKVADEIAHFQAPVSLILVDSPGGKEEAVEIKLENGALMQEAGVLVSLHTDDAITDSRLFLRSGGLAIRAGMSEQAALAALTLNPAEQMDLDDRIGSLEAGKDADFVVLSGAPFSVYTRVEQTWVDGTKVFDFDDPEDRRYATGGWMVSDRYPGGE